MARRPVVSTVKCEAAPEEDAAAAAPEEALGLVACLDPEATAEEPEAAREVTVPEAEARAEETALAALDAAPETAAAEEVIAPDVTPAVVRGMVELPPAALAAALRQESEDPGWIETAWL